VGGEGSRIVVGVLVAVGGIAAGGDAGWAGLWLGEGRIAGLCVRLEGGMVGGEAVAAAGGAVAAAVRTADAVVVIGGAAAPHVLQTHPFLFLPLLSQHLLGYPPLAHHLSPHLSPLPRLDHYPFLPALPGELETVDAGSLPLVEEALE